MKAQTDGPAEPALVSVVRDQLILLGLLVSFAGLVYTDAYYDDFGVKYQLLSLPWYHIVYAGLTAVAQQPWLVLAYALIAVMLQLDAFATIGHGMLLQIRRVFLVLIVPFVLALTYVLARAAGHSRCSLDTNPRTSTLPRVVKLSVEGVRDFGPADEYRVLMVASDHIIVLQPQTGASVVPNIKRFLKGDVHEFETTR